jgi:uncharacterized repeat protein (TIGR01451 family)
MITSSSATRIRTLPIVLALVLNAMAPALSVMAPPAPAPLAAQPVRAAVDPVHVNFTLEGCRLGEGETLPSSLICDDADYTTGNLGKSWNELDLVPHRLTTSLGDQDTATTEYTVGVTADHTEGGVPGYDVLTEPVVNDAKSDDSCQVSAGAQTVISPGVGGTDESLGRLLTITQDKDTICVFDWVQRLALGSHAFPGSSLHSNRTNQLWSTSGIGAADVSLPVNEILPQELSKDMSATQGQAFSWDVEKEANPTSLVFADTCDDDPGARSDTVEITITWTRSGPTGTGETTITTHVYATNPAHRTITINVTDRIYEGAGQTTLLDTAGSGDVDVAAFSEDALILTHSFVYSGSATSFNDVATATYTDKITGIPVPGETTANASAQTEASDDPAENSTVVITDSESISGDHLSFSVAAPSVGSFVGYTAGTSTTGPVNWTSGPVTTSGSVTFTKTVTVDEPAITSGSLSDTATLTGDGDQVLDSANATVDITAEATVELTIEKSIPGDALRDGESVTFDFDIDGPNGFSDSASISFVSGGPTTKSVTLTDLEPGQYTVSEQPEDNWAEQPDEEVTITLPDCDGTVSFDNEELPPDLEATKTADASTVSAGQEIGFTIEISNSDDAGTGIAKDVTLNDPLPAGSGLDWSEDPDHPDCDITGDVGEQVLECDFGDLAPGDSVSVHVVSDTAPADCESYLNVATVDASNHAALHPQDSVTIECPGLNISKLADNSPIVAGSTASYTVVVWNTGPGTALDASWEDEFPHGVNWSFELQDPDSDDTCASSIDIDGNQSGSCEFGDLPPSEMADGKVILIWGETDREDCAGLENTAFAFADNADTVEATAFIDVFCPLVEIDKVNDQDEPVLPGTVVSFTLTVSVSDGPASDVVVVDTVPDGYDDPTAISDGGTWNGTDRTITWNLGDLDDGDYELTYQAAVGLDAEHGDELVNVAIVTSPDSQCPDEENLEPECEDDSTVTVRVPTLVIDKVADVELITMTLDEEANVLDIDPEVVTWTLTYTLTNGPVTNAVISDPIPDGLTYVADSAVPDADFDAGTNTLTWTFTELSESGFVTFQTSVDEDAPAGTITNVTTIDSDETPPDEGEDSIQIVEEVELGGTGTPVASVPNTAMSLPSADGSLATLLFGILLIGSLGALAYANATAVRRRR